MPASRTQGDLWGPIRSRPLVRLGFAAKWVGGRPLLVLTRPNFPERDLTATMAKIPPSVLSEAAVFPVRAWLFGSGRRVQAWPSQSPATARRPPRKRPRAVPVSMTYESALIWVPPRRPGGRPAGPQVPPVTVAPGVSPETDT